MLKSDGVQFKNIQRHDLGACPGQPPTGGGSWDAMPSGESQVARRPYECSKAMVISALNARGRGHASIIACFAVCGKRTETSPKPQLLSPASRTRAENSRMSWQTALQITSQVKTFALTEV